MSYKLILQFKQKKSRVDDFVVLPEGQEAHWEVAERILFIYAKLNPGQGYVQVSGDNSDIVINETGLYGEACHLLYVVLLLIHKIIKGNITEWSQTRMLHYYVLNNTHTCTL